MALPYELVLGWRYTRAGRATRRNGFISFISGVSMLGIALGVAALIIVLSVMNGFQKEVRDRMLAVVSHIEVYGPGGGVLPDVNRTLQEVRRNALSTVSRRVSVVAGFLLLNKATQTIPMGTGYAVWTGIGATGTVITGILFFKEPAGFLRLLFIFLLIGCIIGLKMVSKH